MTTPDINNIYKIFSYLEKNNFDSIAMEVSAHAITQSRVYGLEFDTAILTNITQDHLDYYKTFNEYALAKERLFSEYKIGTSIINLDNAFSRNVYYRIRGEKIGYSIFHPTDIYVKEYRLHEKGIYALLDSSWGKLHLNFSLFGDYNLANLLPAIAILLRKNISISKIEECISSITLPKGRMESIFFDNGLRVIVDFAHSPDALQTLLSSLRKHFNKNIGIVFGCGGNRDKIKRGAMWRIATELADKVWITSDNPRFEKFEDIVADMVSQPSLDFESKEKNYCTEEDRKNAIKQAMMYANSKENFTLVIAGKGHEKYQDIQGVKLDFSDIETIKEVGSSMGLKYV
jgi:UDP-N-acetylmuramoyl-L-alanyl-D-glutamate--2,6-diaminopimelate ligase